MTSACTILVITLPLLHLTVEIFCRPVLLDGDKRYNCRIVIYNSTILCIRPKKILADSGNYREPRWFVPWRGQKQILQFTLPKNIQNFTHQVLLVIDLAQILTLN